MMEQYGDVYPEKKEQVFWQNVILRIMGDIMATSEHRQRYGQVDSIGLPCMKMQKGMLQHVLNDNE